jgi:hypothetical protein
MLSAANQFIGLKVCLIALLFACNPETKVDDIQVQKIIVKTGQHVKIDLEKETYTVYFMNGTSYDSKFTLTDQEKMDIIKMAQDCGLPQLKGNIRMEGHCNIFPVVVTELSFDAGDKHVQVSTDGCDDHSIFKDREAEKIVKFLRFFHKTIYSKPEVAKAPKTDIRYM